MKNFFINLCSEFSDNYDVQEDILGLVIAADIKIADLGDLTEILIGYDFELIEIKESELGGDNCMPVFSKTEVPASGEA